MAEKIYVGNGTSKFDGNQVACSVCLTDLPQEHMFEYNGKKYIKLIVQEKKNTDEYGKTHFVAVDTWKPEPKKEDLSAQLESMKVSPNDPDLPF
jgi:hypothetical protein|tara:strand:- start:2447 stop:2728 length:282 start_codon:yes stop_codon:yes gene_type:complete